MWRSFCCQARSCRGRHAAEVYGQCVVAGSTPGPAAGRRVGAALALLRFRKARVLPCPAAPGLSIVLCQVASRWTYQAANQQAQGILHQIPASPNSCRLRNAVASKLNDCSEFLRTAARAAAAAATVNVTVRCAGLSAAALTQHPSNESCCRRRIDGDATQGSHAANEAKRIPTQPTFCSESPLRLESTYQAFRATKPRNRNALTRPETAL